jgi:hypothetical protein
MWHKILGVLFLLPSIIYLIAGAVTGIKEDGWRFVRGILSIAICALFAIHLLTT